jgi:FHS family Na+ dependent glucose MFS transporter 1
MNFEITTFSALLALRKQAAARRTLGYYLLFICLGLTTAVIGPTLPALADQTHTQVGHMGWLFLAGAVGYTLGTTLGGRVFDRVRGHPVLGTAQLAAAALLVVVPLLPWFWLLLGVLACKGFADGLVNTGANTLLVWTHGEKVGPYMNGLHFCFGLGAFLAPMLVAQVIGAAGGYRWAYWTLAAFVALVSLRLLTLAGNPRPAPHRDSGTSALVGARSYSPLVIVAALFLFFYVGAEVAFGGWVYTYAVALQLASAVGAAYLTSGFWLAFTLGRLLSIPMATRFAPPQIILAALCTCLSLLALGIIIPDSSLVLWVVTLGLGFCMAPLWPTGFTLAGRSLPLTASVSGMILLGDSFGALVLPWLVGQAIAVTGPRALVYLVFGSLLGNVWAFVTMLRLRPPCNRQLIGLGGQADDVGSW